MCCVLHFSVVSALEFAVAFDLLVLLPLVVLLVRLLMVCLM